MKTILAIAALLAVTACEGSPYMQNYGPGGRYEGHDPYAGMIVANGGLIRPYAPPATPMGYQTITMPNGRMVSCTSIGSATNCY